MGECTVREGMELVLKLVGRSTLALVLSCWVILAGARIVDARGLMVPLMPRVGGVSTVRLNAMRVDVQVEAGVAQVQVQQRFVNHGQTQAEGTYLFPVPSGAALDSFEMTVDGKAYHGDLLDANEARRLYHSIVNQNRDPALLQFVGEGALQASVFPIAPGEERQVTVSYTQVLGREINLSLFHFPMGPDAAEADLVVHIDWRSERPLQTIYSPSHHVSITRSGEQAALVTYEGKGGTDFRLYAGGTASDVDVNLLSYRAPGEDGYFLLIASPPVASSTHGITAKDVVLVLDLSGSMAGEKFDQAKEAARHVLQSLGQADRFGIVGFHGGTVSFAERLSGAEQKQAGLTYVDRLELGGATNIAAGMAEAQGMLGKGEAGRPQVILLITDGLPTVGETDPHRIVAAVQAQATEAQRIFTFGVGYDVDTVLLDAMAHDNRGLSTYVKPGENLEEAVSTFWRKVGQPVLTDLRLNWSGVKVEEVYPQPLPDLYQGDQLVVTGRYRDGGQVSVTLTGRVDGKEMSYNFLDRSLTHDDRSRDFIPRLWAQRKVGSLLSQLRRYPDHPELVDEVIRLSQRYGIVTPYTSFFVPEPGAFAGAADAAAQARAAVQRAAMAPTSGKAAVTAADAVNHLRASETVAPQTSAVRQAGEKTFLYKEGIWVDTAYDGSVAPIAVAFGSKAYFDLMRGQEAGSWFAVGLPLTVVMGEQAYTIRDTGGALWEAQPDAEPTGEEPLETAVLSAQEAGAAPRTGYLWVGALLVGVVGVTLSLWRKRAL